MGERRGFQSTWYGLIADIGRWGDTSLTDMAVDTGLPYNASLAGPRSADEAARLAAGPKPESILRTAFPKRASKPTGGRL